MVRIEWGGWFGDAIKIADVAGGARRFGLDWCWFAKIMYLFWMMKQCKKDWFRELIY
jgi:hypothetical protein